MSVCKPMNNIEIVFRHEDRVLLMFVQIVCLEYLNVIHFLNLVINHGFLVLQDSFSLIILSLM